MHGLLKTTRTLPSSPNLSIRFSQEGGRVTLQRPKGPKSRAIAVLTMTKQLNMQLQI